MRSTLKNMSVPQRIVTGGHTYFSVLAVAQVLGRSTRTVTRLEKRGILHPVRGLGGSNNRWYLEADVVALGRIAEESGFKDNPISQPVWRDFATRVSAWQRSRRQPEEAKQRWSDINQGNDDRQRENTSDEQDPQTQRFRRNLLQYREGQEWEPYEEADIGGIEVVVCPTCEGPLHDITDQFGRLAATCSRHGRVNTPLKRVKAAREPVAFVPYPNARQRHRGLLERDIVGAVRTPGSRPSSSTSRCFPRNDPQGRTLKVDYPK